MASAGRILIMPKGNYDSNATYDMLDLVFHGGASWIAKKTVVGIEPTDESIEHWMKMCESVDLADIKNRLSALEGKPEIDLSGYALKTEVKTVSDDLDALEQIVAGLNQTVSGISVSLAEVEENANQPTSKCAVVAYTGTGTVNDANNPARVTFEFAPKAIILLGWESKALNTTNNQTYITQSSVVGSANNRLENVIFCDALTTEYKATITAGFVNQSNNNTPARYAKKSEDGKTIYWYAQGSTALDQCNYASYTYYVLGIG